MIVGDAPGAGELRERLVASGINVEVIWMDQPNTASKIGA
jgi:hypothetical protein